MPKKLLSGVDTITCTEFHVLANQLEGSLPPDLVRVHFLVASGNLFEGTFPERMHLHPQMLQLSGLPGRMSGLSGPLPLTMSRLRTYSLAFTASYQKLEGIIPPVATLDILVLQSNKFKLISDSRFSDRKSGRGSFIFLHNNQLSCQIPNLVTQLQ